MDDAIIENLNDVADEHGVEIINARQRGSRRINAEHDDSDHDVLFLFKNPISEYAIAGGPTVSSIHAPDDPIDIHGWDIKKFATLLLDSNPDAINYCRTEKEYVSASGDFESMAQDALQNANLMALYYHYISMAKSNYTKYVEPEREAPASRQFHIANAIAAAGHIRSSDELHPLDINSLIQSGYIHSGLADTLEEMLMHRQDGNGGMVLDDFVGEYYEMESEYRIEANERRTRTPSRQITNDFIREEVTNGSR